MYITRGSDINPLSLDYVTDALTNTAITSVSMLGLYISYPIQLPGCMKTGS